MLACLFLERGECIKVMVWVKSNDSWVFRSTSKFCVGCPVPFKLFAPFSTNCMGALQTAGCRLTCVCRQSSSHPSGCLQVYLLSCKIDRPFPTVKPWLVERISVLFGQPLQDGARLQLSPEHSVSRTLGPHRRQGWWKKKQVEIMWLRHLDHWFIMKRYVLKVDCEDTWFVASPHQLALLKQGRSLNQWTEG